MLDLTISQMHPTISQELLHRVGTGSIIIKRNISKINTDSVTFEDNTTVKADVIIFCTGYKIDIPFVDKKVCLPARIMACPILTHLCY